ncbi:hypothetical protein QBC44DRAFT_391721 [Cladorrhinum sp. PSN332]|nr:hypothetical protein QBC44DRAFT_391721 [Cladorrhinum sp. PSN332]
MNTRLEIWIGCGRARSGMCSEISDMQAWQGTVPDKQRPVITSWFGQLFKNKRELSFQECGDALERIEDEHIFPSVPEGVELTLALNHLNAYESFKGTDYGR